MLCLDESKSKIKQLVELSKKYQVRLNQNIKKNVCFDCYNLLIPAKTCKSRVIKTQSGVYLVIICECKKEKRFCFRGAKGKRGLVCGK